MFDLFKTKVYLKLFMSYIISFIVPFLLINFLTFSISSNSYKNDMSALKVEYSENFKYNLDSQLAEITLTSNMISHNPQIWAFNIKNRDVDYTDFIYSAKLVANSISNYFSYNPSHYTIALYFPSQNCIITPESHYTPREYFELNYNGKISYSTFLNYLSANKISMYPTKSQTNESTLTIMQPIYNSNNYSAKIICRVSVDSMININNMLNAHNTLNSKASDTYNIILDSNGNTLYKSENLPDNISVSLLTRNNEENTIDIPGGYFATYQKSNVYPIRYYCIFPYNNVSDNFRIARTILWFVLFFGSVLFLLISFTFTMRMFTPFKALLTVGNSSPYKIENYSQIQTLIFDIINSNQELSNTLEKQRSSTSNNLFKTLLQNSAELDNDSFKLMFEHYESQFVYQNWQIAVIKLDNKNTEDTEMLQFSLMTAIKFNRF